MTVKEVMAELERLNELQFWVYAKQAKTKEETQEWQNYEAIGNMIEKRIDAIGSLRVNASIYLDEE